MCNIYLYDSLEDNLNATQLFVPFIIAPQNSKLFVVNCSLKLLTPNNEKTTLTLDKAMIIMLMMTEHNEGVRG